jgi:hypothetical protein
MRRTRWSRRSRCCACLRPVKDGTLVCCPECDELWWKIVPTLSGDLWVPKW